ncbi:hypothetical protein BaRGS_00021100, partial [Batillaria attramentaria]
DMAYHSLVHMQFQTQPLAKEYVVQLQDRYNSLFLGSVLQTEASSLHLAGEAVQPELAGTGRLWTQKSQSVYISALADAAHFGRRFAARKPIDSPLARRSECLQVDGAEETAAKTRRQLAALCVAQRTYYHRSELRETKDDGYEAAACSYLESIFLISV